MTTYELLDAELGDQSEVKIEYGAFGVSESGASQRRYLTIRRGLAHSTLVVSIYGTTIAILEPDRVTLWARGHGDKPSTRAALAECYRGRGSVHSERRLLWAGGHPFREGMVLSYDGRLLDPGEGEQVDGAPPRRRRDEYGTLR